MAREGTAGEREAEDTTVTNTVGCLEMGEIVGFGFRRFSVVNEKALRVCEEVVVVS